MARFQRSQDPDRPGQLLLQAGAPVALVVWAHDYSERDHTGWFLTMLDDEGEPDGRAPRRITVSDDVERLVADVRLDRDLWLARAETLELVTAAVAVTEGERMLAHVLGA